MLCWRGPMLKGPVILQSRIEIKNEKELNETSTCPVWGSFSVTLIARKFATYAVFSSSKKHSWTASFFLNILAFRIFFCQLLSYRHGQNSCPLLPALDHLYVYSLTAEINFCEFSLQPARCRGGRIRSLLSACLLGSPLLCRVLGTLRVTTLVWWWWREQKSLEKAIQSF